MPKFLIEFHNYDRDIFLGEAVGIAGADTLEKAKKLLRQGAGKFDYAIVYELRENMTYRKLRVELRKRGGLENEERGQGDKVGLRE